MELAITTVFYYRVIDQSRRVLITMLLKSLLCQKLIFAGVSGSNDNSTRTADGLILGHGRFLQR